MDENNKPQSDNTGRALYLVTAIGSKIAVFIGALFAIIGSIGVLGGLQEYYQLLTDNVNINFEGTPYITWGSASSSLLLALLITFVGVGLLMIANRSKHHSRALAKLGVNPTLDCWFIDSDNSQPIEAKLYLNSKQRTLSILGSSQQQLYSSSLDSKTLEIKVPLSFRLTALYLSDSGRDIALSFTKEPRGLHTQRKNFIIALFFGWPGELAAIVSTLSSGGMENLTTAFGSNLTEYLHRWFRHYKIQSYRSKLSTGEFGMLFLVGLIPGFFVIVGIIGFIVSLFS